MVGKMTGRVIDLFPLLGLQRPRPKAEGREQTPVGELDGTLRLPPTPESAIAKQGLQSPVKPIFVEQIGRPGPVETVVLHVIARTQVGTGLLRDMAGLLILHLLLRLDPGEDLEKCARKMTQLIGGTLMPVSAVLSVSVDSVCRAWAMMAAAWIAIS